MKKNQTIDELMNEFFDYMRSIHRCEGTLKRYRRNWKRVNAFMQYRGIRFYDGNVGRSYLKHELGNFDYHQLDRQKRDLVNIIEALTEFQESGRVFKGARKHKPKEFHGPWAVDIKAFIEYKKQVIGLSRKTIASYLFYLYPFCCYLNSNKISKKNIKPSGVLAYVERLNPDLAASKHVALNIIKNFFVFLFDQQILHIDFSRIIPRNNYKHQPKLPSTFTDEEIESLLKTIDRGNPRGKRDYSILLLATRLGLRASDICELTFDNILWDRNVIILNQVKTKRKQELPLLPEVGNAIVDYLKHGRPVTGDNHCFIHVYGPYERMHSHDIGNMVRKYMTQAKINYSNRKHGSHCLRHSLASALLKEKVPLPVISEVLGHSSMESTMDYLRIDIAALKKCALEVPPLHTFFYEQKGGKRNG
ncbi:tyrosine-type recombinase/integrase [Negadavirga shengliensis]|uniref:Tyrosine-type recombinase/integrase n=1 Tax=Negadavirga shengliensis TaxID=1389218 RepID=A0ABV9T8Y9_9BACT